MEPSQKSALRALVGSGQLIKKPVPITDPLWIGKNGRIETIPEPYISHLRMSPNRIDVPLKKSKLICIIFDQDWKVAWLCVPWFPPVFFSFKQWLSLSSRRTLAQFWSIIARRKTFLNYIKFADHLIVRLWNCERVRRLFETRQVFFDGVFF